jgi:iron-sulfur cluster repair protein YtfE (RIC family)
VEIYQVLKEDHKVVKALCKKLDDTTERSHKERLELLTKLKETLLPHARAEEKIFYEPLKESEVKDADDLAFEGYEEHWVADKLIAELEKTETADKRWGALMSVLKEALEHHIEEEEEDMFKKGHKSFDRDVAQAMAEEFIELKKKYLARLRAGKKLKQPPSHEIKISK